MTAMDSAAVHNTKQGSAPGEQSEVARAHAAGKRWRRSGPLVPAGRTVTGNGEIDYGHFGPSSLVWQVMMQPVVTPLIEQVTASLMMGHGPFQAVMLEHDPTLIAMMRGKGRLRMVSDRLRRTVGIPVGIIFGDSRTAEELSAHLRRYHGKMVGTIPGSDRRYDAAGPELSLFAAVTIMHAALIIYEHAAFVDRHFPRRLAPVDRDRYFAEAAQFAILMGARPADVPRSAAELRQYYQAIDGEHFDVFGKNVFIGPIFQSTLLPKSLADVKEMMLTVTYFFSIFPVIGMIPKPFRRKLRIPRLLDVLFDIGLKIVQPLFVLFTVPFIGQRVVGYMTGPENIGMSPWLRALVEQTRREGLTAHGRSAEPAAVE